MSGNPSPHGDDERSLLLHAMAEESLSGDQERRLSELLRTDAAFRREYVRFCELLTQLMWEFSASHEVTPHDLPKRPTESENPGQVERDGATARRRSLRYWCATFAFIITAVVLGLVWVGPLRPGAPGSVIEVRGQVEVVRDGRLSTRLGPEDVAREPWLLRRDDLIRTAPNGSATVTLADHTEIRIGPGAELVLAGRSDASVMVSRGRIAARVAPQPARRPMTFVTPSAAVRVLGTELELLVLHARTDVAVTEGKVRVTRTVDEASVEVAATQFVSVEDPQDRLAELRPLAVVDWPLPPDVWSEDFENGPPTGWTGRLVRDGLPAGSRGGLQAGGVSDARGRSTELSSPIAEHGLFAWHADSVLHLTFRVQPPAWFHICLFARTYQRREPLVAWCCIDPDLWQTRPGDWRTVRVPLTAFHRVGYEQGDATLGRIPVRLTFIGPGDLPGLVIDEVRVDRSGASSRVETASDFQRDQP